MEAISEYDYICVLDFEAQCVEDQKLECQEIIEFPIIIVDVKSQKVIDEYFHHYLKPVIHTTLFDFCKELTGITQEQVDNGKLLQDVLNELDLFLKRVLTDKSFIFVTCGDWDLKQCLRTEAAYKNIEYPDYLNKWINVKKIFSELKGINKCGMAGMLYELGLTLEGRHHSGIDDTRNIAKIVITLLQNNLKFTSDKVTQNTKKKKIKSKK
jgi:inhibitor of KinA sporulation pathway (predicted exonuclease)